MAAGAARRGAGRAKDDSQPDHPQARTGIRKRNRSPQDEDDRDGDVDSAAEHRQKTRKTRQSSDRQLHKPSRSGTQPTRKSLRLQEKQSVNQQPIRRVGQTRTSSQRQLEVSDCRTKDKSKGPSPPLRPGTGAGNNTKRRRLDSGGESNQEAKRPRQHVEVGIVPAKSDAIRNWLDETFWSLKSSTSVDSEQLEAFVNMPRKPPSDLPSSKGSLESTLSLSTSKKSAASVSDPDFRVSLRDRNVFIERARPPPELVQRSRNIMSRTRASPDLDDATVEELIEVSLAVQEDGEEQMISELAPDIIPSMKKLPDPRLSMNKNQLWWNSVPIPHNSKLLATPLPLPKPKPDLIYGYSEAAFTGDQRGTIKLLVDDQFGRSYAVPDQKVQFPFLQVEFKSQAKNGSHYIATNQAAGGGAIAMNGNVDLIERSFGMASFDYNEPQYFSVTVDHLLACVNVHWLERPAENGQHSFHVHGLSRHLLNDANAIRALSRAIKNILDYGLDSRLGTLCSALDQYRAKVLRDRAAANPQTQEDEVAQPPQAVRRPKRNVVSRMGAVSPGEDSTIRGPPPETREAASTERPARRAQATTRRSVRSRADPASNRIPSKRTSKAAERD